MSNSWAIFSSLMRRALKKWEKTDRIRNFIDFMIMFKLTNRSRALIRCCLAAMQRMWSSNVNTELSTTSGLPFRFVFFIVMFNDRLSSLSGLTSTSFIALIQFLYLILCVIFSLKKRLLLELDLRISRFPNRFVSLRARLVWTGLDRLLEIDGLFFKNKLK